jgi:rare lipoprotein A
MKTILLLAGVSLAFVSSSPGATNPTSGVASWYGEAHRGRLMANGKKFDPDKLTAASWFYPLGTRLWVTTDLPGHAARRVQVTVTDRGPARQLVREGRIIDLGRAAFKALAHPDDGLVAVRITPVEEKKSASVGPPAQVKAILAENTDSPKAEKQ